MSNNQGNVSIISTSTATGETQSSGLGELLEDFTPKKVLGEGEYGKVYLAKNRHDEHVYAIKKVTCGGDSSNSLQEVKALSEMFHPNIVRYFGCRIVKTENEDNKLCIMMEYCVQESLQANLDKDNITMPIFWTTVDDMLSALKYLDKIGRRHGDIQAQNIFYGQNFVAKLGDFGWTCTTGRDELVEGEKQSRKKDMLNMGSVFEEVFYKCIESSEDENGDMDHRIEIQTEIIKDLIEQMKRAAPEDRPQPHKLIEFLDRQREANFIPARRLLCNDCIELNERVIDLGARVTKLEKCIEKLFERGVLNSDDLI